MSNRHTELCCYAKYSSGREAVPVPRTRISMSEEGVELAGETGMGGSLRFIDTLDPGIYIADIADVPVGFSFSGAQTVFALSKEK